MDDRPHPLVHLWKSVLVEGLKEYEKTQTLCGTDWTSSYHLGRLTKDPEKVTCKKCKKAIEKHNPKGE